SVQFLFKAPWPRVFLLRTFTILPLTALFAWTAQSLPRRRWRAVAIAGVVMTICVYAVDLPSRIWIAMYEPPFALRLGPLSVDPRAAVYLLGFTTFVVSMAFPGDLFDRYVFAFLPFVILFAVRGSGEWRTPGWALSAAALVLVGAFSLIAQADNMDHASARWA